MWPCHARPSTGRRFGCDNPIYVRTNRYRRFARNRADGCARAAENPSYCASSLTMQLCLRPAELARFLRLFRRPIFAAAQRSLAGFFRLCGFKEEYQKTVQHMLELCIQRCITVRRTAYDHCGVTRQLSVLQRLLTVRCDCRYLSITHSKALMRTSTT